MEPGYAVVLVTTPSVEIANTIATELVDKNLAACVNILPAINSIYAWQGNTVDDQEVMLVIKTRIDLFEDQLIPAIQGLHPYEVPEIIALPIMAGYKDYLEWIDKETSG